MNAWAQEYQVDAPDIRDRIEAGALSWARPGPSRVLAPLVLGEPDGGIPVAAAVAHRLGAGLTAVLDEP